MSRAEAIRVSDPEHPDNVSRRAGIDIYGTSVGMLRRPELWRLGNAWGMNFPIGATKDFMLPYFQQLEAEGKNPLQPPTGTLDAVVKARAVTHTAENHSETAEEEGETVVIAPAPKTEFEQQLETLPHWRLKTICRERGIQQTNTDRKHDLIARIIAK